MEQLEITNPEPEITKLGNGLFKARYDELFSHFKSSIPEEVFFRDQDHSGYITFTERELRDMREKHRRHVLFEFNLFRCTQLNNMGIDLEKRGDLQSAIDVYEENIEGDCYPARHSFDRLLVLYRKAKRYQDEKRICIKAISLFKEPKYQKRLDKINVLIARSSH